MVELAICAIAALGLWFGLDWPLWACIAAVAAVWFLVRGQAHGAAPTGAIDAVTRIFGSAAGFVKGFFVTMFVFSAIIMVGSRVIAVAPAAAADELKKFGWLPWNWGHFGWPAIALVLVAIIAAYAGSQAATGNGKLAGWMIVLSLGAILAVRWMPVTLAGTFPSERATTYVKVGNTVVPVVDEKPSPTWAATDTTIAEKGAVSVVANAVTTPLIGQPADLKRRGRLGSSVCRSAHWAFGEELWFGICDNKQRPNKPAKASAPRPAPAPSQYQPAVYHSPVPVPERRWFDFGPDGCTTDPMKLVGDASFYPKGGWVTIIPPEPATPWADAPGITNNQEGIEKPPGKYQVCSRDTDDLGNPAQRGHAIEVWGIFDGN